MGDEEDPRVPRLVVETTQAIFEKRRGQWLDAFFIARGTLVKNGFLMSGSESGPIENIKLTGKGQKRDREMMRRPARRVILFNRFFEKHRGEFGDNDKAERSSTKAAKDESG